MNSRWQLLASIAELYYTENRSQAEIARKTGYSRSAISRLLTEARESGVVEIKINHPIGRAERLENRLMGEFGLQMAIIADRGSKSYQSVLNDVGQLGAQYLDSQLSNDQTIAISLGAGVTEMVNAMPSRQLPGIKVVQVLGGSGSSDPLFDGHEIARGLAEKLGARYWAINAPLIVKDHQTQQLFLAESKIEETLEMASKAHIALVGIGTTEIERSSLVRGNYITIEEAREIKAKGAVGDIYARQIDQNGLVMNIGINNRVVGIDPHQLIARDCTIVGVAAGRKKAEAILATLRGRFIDVLISDSRAAEEILNLATNRQAYPPGNHQSHYASMATPK